MLAHRRGRRTAARLAHERSLGARPDSPVAHVNLANILMEDGALNSHARTICWRFASTPALPPPIAASPASTTSTAIARAKIHWALAGEGGCERRAKRGVGPGVPVLLITSAKLGNMPISPWLDDGLFDAHIIEAESFGGDVLPPHALMINLIGDADLCADALGRAEKIAALSHAPLLNPPALVAATGRLDNARRLGALPGVETPRMRLFSRQDLSEIDNETFPLLLRAARVSRRAALHRVERREDLAAALATLPGDEIIVMSPLDARGADGRHRKYRAMAIGKKWFPLHLAVSADWKVHYFSADMGARPEPRAEERRFLDCMPSALGARASAALAAIAETVGLDYFGVDFALAAQRSAAHLRSQRCDGDARPAARADMGLPPPRARRRSRHREGDGVARRAG